MTDFLKPALAVAASGFFGTFGLVFLITSLASSPSEAQEGPLPAGTVYLLTPSGKKALDSFVGPVVRTKDGLTEWQNKAGDRRWTSAALVFEETKRP